MLLASADILAKRCSSARGLPADPLVVAAGPSLCSEDACVVRAANHPVTAATRALVLRAARVPVVAIHSSGTAARAAMRLGLRYAHRRSDSTRLGKIPQAAWERSARQSASSFPSFRV